MSAHLFSKDMKKLLLITSLFYTSLVVAQQEKKDVLFFKEFEIGLKAINLTTNKSMMGDAHQIGHSLFAKLGIVHYKSFSLGIHGNISGMQVKDTQYYGVFDKTSFNTIGVYAGYFYPMSDNIYLEPHLSYNASKYTAKDSYKELNYGSQGLGIGLDFQYRVNNGLFLSLGLQYTINKLDTTTHQNWQKYLNNYNFLSAKIAFKFAKYRF